MPNEKRRQRRLFIRSARGQLAMLGVVFAGALVLAVTALFLKEIFFRGYIRHRTVPLTEFLKHVAAGVADGSRNESEIEDMDEVSVRALYGALIDATVNDPEKRLTAALLKFHQRRVLGRLRITVAAGSREQRFRAIQLLVDRNFEDDEIVLELCRAAGMQARRQGDTKLRELAESVVASIESLPREPVDELTESEKGLSDE